MNGRSSAWLPVAILIVALCGCGSAPTAKTGSSQQAAVSLTPGCSSPIASKSWYMQPALLEFQDRDRGVDISFYTYNPFQATGIDGTQAFFSVPGGDYAFGPNVQQTSSGVFTLSFNGAGEFVGSGYKRPATIKLSGSADENTGAADLTLAADGSTFRLHLPAVDISGAVALSRHVAVDIQSKNWPDLYSSFSPSLKESGYTEALMASDLNAMYRHITNACRLGPAYYLRSGDSLLSDDVTDILAVTVQQPSGGSISTFATIHLEIDNGSWSFLGGSPPGTAPGATGPHDFGIPAPSP